MSTICGDNILVNFELNEDQRLIQKAAREFSESELEPMASVYDSGGGRDDFLANLKRLAELGFMGMNIGSRYGGAEAGAIASSLAITEIARACASTAVTVSVTNMVAEVIQSIANEDQRNKYLPKICSGEYYAAGFCLTESSAGSDIHHMQNRSSPTGALTTTKTGLTHRWGMTRHLNFQRHTERDSGPK